MEPKFNNIPNENVEPWLNNIPNEKVEPVYSVPKGKVVKHVHLEDEVEVIPIQSSVHDKSEKLVMDTTDGGSTEVIVESKKSEGKIKEKLAMLKKQTEEEVMRMKEKTSGLVNSLKAQKEQSRGRSRYLIRNIKKCPIIHPAFFKF